MTLTSLCKRFYGLFDLVIIVIDSIIICYCYYLCFISLTCVLFQVVICAVLSGDDEEGDSGGSVGSQNHGYDGLLNHLDVDTGGQKTDDQHSIEMRSNRQDPSQMFPTLQDKKGGSSMLFWALMKLRFLLVVRSKAAWVFMLVLPVGLVTGGLVLSKQSSSSDSTPVAMAMSGVMYAKSSVTQDASLPKFLLRDSVGKCDRVLVLF